MDTIIYINPEFEDALNQIPKDVSRELDLSANIAMRILEILERKGWSQRQFAKAMEKKDAEISRWLSGGHNFTIATIAKIEAVLGEDIISVKKYRKPVTGHAQMPKEKRQWLSENDRPKYGRKKK